MFCVYVLRVDAFAQGLIKAARIIRDRRMDAFIAGCYSSYNSGIGSRIRSGRQVHQDTIITAGMFG